MKKLYVFDLDGVLIDSLPNMKLSWGIVQLNHRIEIQFEEYAKHIGKPFNDILEEIGIHHDHASIKKTYDEMSNTMLEKIEIYPKTFEVLKELKNRGCKIAICTSKDGVRAKAVLESLGFPEFDFICSPKKGLRGKPSPDQLLNTIAFCNIDPKDTVYIGDMQSDYECALRAGVDFIHANYGYGQVKCEVSVNQIEQLLSL